MPLTDLVTFFFVALSAVFFVVDPIGVVPIFLAITSNDPPEKIRQMARRACFTGYFILMTFAIFGGVIFKIFGISLGAFRVAGGLLLMLTALDMLRAKRPGTRTSPEETEESARKEDVALVPLAMPLLAGPGSIASVMVLMSQGNTRSLLYAVPVLLAVTITFVAAYFILRAASLVQRVLGQSGVAILERVMGLILAAIAVQFVADGARDLLRTP
ncbi:MarC family protein [Polyangium sp. 15x6]|nr:MarC family protein [Polyangium sp. 15x6]MDI3287500.1 MarC family protein [Polyangium sp. 15x6]